MTTVGFLSDIVLIWQNHISMKIFTMYKEKNICSSFFFFILICRKDNTFLYFQCFFANPWEVKMSNSCILIKKNARSLKALFWFLSFDISVLLYFTNKQINTQTQFWSFSEYLVHRSIVFQFNNGIEISRIFAFNRREQDRSTFSSMVFATRNSTRNKDYHTNFPRCLQFTWYWTIQEWDLLPKEHGPFLGQCPNLPQVESAVFTAEPCGTQDSWCLISHLSRSFQKKRVWPVKRNF